MTEQTRKQFIAEHAARLHLDTLANAAIGTHFAFLGAKKGSEVAKVGRPPGITGMEGIGMIPSAPVPGDCLDNREIAELGRMHA